LTALLIKFCFSEFPATADITKMYLMIRVDDGDIPYQRTFIGTDPDGPLEEMEMPTVIFGARSSPWLALRTLAHIADLEESSSPTASYLLRNNFYIDDYLASFEDEQDAVNSTLQLRDVLEKYKFKLCQLATTSKMLLNKFDKNDCRKETEKSLEKTQANEVKLLGMKWNREDDQLFYRVKPLSITTLRRNDALSIVAGIYDPIGFLQPTLIKGRILIQKICAGVLPTKESWRQKVPDDLTSEFTRWATELSILNQLRIPRWMNHKENQEECLVGFADASEKAYGCVIYLRVKENDRISSRIVTAKSRVAPSSKKFVPQRKAAELTLPRLELMAATMLTKSVDKVLKAIPQLKNVDIWMFSDSQVTLAWIQGDTTRWDTFVANRVKQIKSVVPQARWFYVHTKENPADMASRGVAPTELLKNEFWFQGPKFINQKEIKVNNAFNETQVGLRRVYQIATVVAFAKNSIFINEIAKISDWTRSVIYMARFVRVADKIRGKKFSQEVNKLSRTDKYALYEKYTVNELKAAENIIFRIHQQNEWPSEYQELMNGYRIEDGQLRQLNPYLDEFGVMREIGRADRAYFLTEYERRPIIIPKLDIQNETHKTASLTKKIIWYAHESTGHGGAEKTLCLLRQKFSFSNDRNAVRWIINNCVICRRFNAKTCQQRMGLMPEEAVNPAPAFYHTMLDYAGPISIQYTKRKTRSATNMDDETKITNSKAWIAVFVCRVTGMYHIELVSKLTKDAYLGAYKRYVSTRGLPKTLRTDNQTCFGAAKKFLLKEYFDLKKIK
jgi:Pao retrotransposon peptidase/Integrase zinc binding domain